jgi:tRNA(fMet)-specific endonuclease VapC
MKVLLDTNSVSAWLNGNPAVTQPLHHVTEVIFSVVVLGELLAGYRAGRRYEKNVSVLRRMLALPQVDLREIGFETAESFGRLSAELRERGTPIPTNDVWIAAQALEAGAELWSFDEHFSRVEALMWRHLR